MGTVFLLVLTSLADGHEEVTEAHLTRAGCQEAANAVTQRHHRISVQLAIADSMRVRCREMRLER